MICLRRVLAVMAATVLVLTLASCGGSTPVSYEQGAQDGALRVLVGGEGYRDVLEYAAAQRLAGDVQLELVDAGPDGNRQLANGDADLAFHQTQPAFLGNREANSLDTLSIVSKVDVAPYALYSSKWKDLDETADWVNSNLVEDRVTGTSLPHGATLAVPSTTSGFARALYLLQTVNLVTLDRPSGGLTVADLSISQANVLDSQRHLTLRGIDFATYARDIYQNYDAVVLDPTTATNLGLVPAKDALAIEPGPGNPYARVLVAPSRLSGDPRVSALAHALEGPEVAEYLDTTYRGKFISAHVPFRP